MSLFISRKVFIAVAGGNASRFLGFLVVTLALPILPSRAQSGGSDQARANALARHSWKESDQPAWLTSDLFTKEIQPLLASVPMCVIRSSIGVSNWYASKIRQGYRPHPRHWQTLAGVVMCGNSRLTVTYPVIRSLRICG